MNIYNIASINKIKINNNNNNKIISPFNPASFHVINCIIL